MIISIILTFSVSFSYVFAIVRLITNKIDGNIGVRNGVEMEIGNDGNTKTIAMENNDNDDQALQLHSIQTSSESFLQMVIQIYFLVLLVVMGGATLIAGREAEIFFNDICKTIFATSNVHEFRYRCNLNLSVSILSLIL